MISNTRKKMILLLIALMGAFGLPPFLIQAGKSEKVIAMCIKQRVPEEVIQKIREKPFGGKFVVQKNHHRYVYYTEQIQQNESTDIANAEFYLMEALTKEYISSVNKHIHPEELDLELLKRVILEQSEQKTIRFQFNGQMEFFTCRDSGWAQYVCWIPEASIQSPSMPDRTWADICPVYEMFFLADILEQMQNNPEKADRFHQVMQKERQRIGLNSDIFCLATAWNEFLKGKHRKAEKNLLIFENTLSGSQLDLLKKYGIYQQYRRLLKKM